MHFLNSELTLRGHHLAAVSKLYRELFSFQYHAAENISPDDLTHVREAARLMAQSQFEATWDRPGYSAEVYGYTPEQIQDSIWREEAVYRYLGEAPATTPIRLTTQPDTLCSGCFAGRISRASCAPHCLEPDITDDVAGLNKFVTIAGHINVPHTTSNFGDSRNMTVDTNLGGMRQVITHAVRCLPFSFSFRKR